ncbi:MAG TPA: PH domain-containing protein, partial [Salinimicrobium sp.]|nr:PH domain-containing protein [Salinimicrobium sp.]
IIGVYSVQIDTAGSGQEEAEIKALSRSKAERLAQLLMQYSTVESGKDSDEPVETKEKQQAAPAWEFKLGLSGILKLGLTSNYLRGLALLFAFYFTLIEQLNFAEEFPIGSDFSNVSEMISEEHIRIEDGLSSSLPGSLMMEIISTILLFLGLFLIGMIITVGETFIKYYNLTLKKTDAGLQVEMGLRDNTRINVTARRVQVMKVITNPLQKRMDLHQLQISVASSEDSLSKKRIKIPGLPREIVKAVKNYLYLSGRERSSVLVPDKILLYRKISRRILPLVLALILLRLSSLDLSLWTVSILSVLYLSAGRAYQYCFYRSIRLTVSSEFLYKYSGIWNRKIEIIEVYKLQAVSLTQPIWYKNRQLVDLTFHSSGGDISFKLIQKQQALELANYLLYKIEDSKKPWM